VFGPRMSLFGVLMRLEGAYGSLPVVSFLLGEDFFYKASEFGSPG